MTAMATYLPLICLLATFSPRPGAGLEILGLSLDGGSKEYLEVGSKAQFVLRCDYRTGYDDPVQQVRWFMFGYPVYTWREHHNPTVSHSLLGLVDINPAKEPHNIHFTHVDYTLAGNYTCQVSAATATVEDTYSLYVIDASSAPYNTRVQVLSVINNSSGNHEDNKYEVTTTEPSNIVEFENADCTLVWSFVTPAIFPRPNVTCGYYSFDHDDVIQRLPAGLTMHKFPNGSWRGSFESTHIEVASIPKNHRLGCTVRIPETSYKKVIKADDDFIVDALIDNTGCPGLTMDHAPGLNVEIQDATYTCHDDVIPAERNGAAIAKLSCPAGHTAKFPDGSVKRGWQVELSCQENDVGWRTRSDKDKKNLGTLFDIAGLPYCEPGMYSSAYGIGDSFWVVLLTLLSLAVMFGL
nr:uncharacterized protein LOC123762933 [Procambarus clarkii]